MRSADSNIFLYAANPASPSHRKATDFLEQCMDPNVEFAICELVLIEIYMLLRNPSVLAKPLDSRQAVGFCEQLRANPHWQLIDYEPAVSLALWTWARSTKAGFRRIIDARLALTLLHHGVTEFATANIPDFKPFGFSRLWNPLLD